MLLGALGAVIAWGIATLILWGHSDMMRTSLGVVAGVAVSVLACWLLAELMAGPGAIPVGGIVGAFAGAAGAVATARKKTTAPTKT